MIVRLTAGELRVGMTVVDTGRSWIDHPYLYAKPGVIASEDHLARIHADGFTAAYVEQPDQQPSPEAGPASAAKAPGAPSALLRELDMAREIRSRSLAFIHSMLEAAEEGAPPDLDTAAATVGEMVQSLSRNLDALFVLAKLKSHDDYTFAHSVNVTVLTLRLGLSLGLGAEQIRELGLAAILHDLGKARMPKPVLNKPGRLTPEEFTVMQAHPQEGLRILSASRKLPGSVLRGVGEHHEKHDGTGYPLRLAGEAIHPYARLVALADVFDALTSDRCYKPGILPHEALRIMHEQRDRHFSGNLLAKFVRTLGVYPVGSFVRLSNGWYAVVLAANPAAPHKPKVVAANDEDFLPLDPVVLDLSSPDAPAWITKALDPVAAGVDPLEILARVAEGA